MERGGPGRLRPRLSWTIALVALACGADRGDEVLDRRSFPYRDPHEGGRVVALVELELRAGTAGSGGSAELRIRPSAVGPLVEPIRDVRGVRGANHQTARELDALVAADDIFVRVRSNGGDVVERVSSAGRTGRSGAPVGAQRDTLPERRVRADGTLDHDARSSETYVTDVELVTPALGPGKHTVEVVVRGEVRLAIDVELETDRGRTQGHIVDVRGRAAADDPPVPDEEEEPNS